MASHKILILGAGRSAFTLMEYLSERAESMDYKIVVVDRTSSRTLRNIKNFRGLAMDADITDKSVRRELIRGADIVISMLPASHHVTVAKDCIEFGKNMVTASYVTEEMEELDGQAKKAGITLMNEIGLDPGIDHLSAMKIIDDIRDNGGKVLAFESFTGGLLAPESERDNPWKYKFTWNPRNVVLAGSGGAVKFIDNGMYKYIPYHRVFRRTEIIDLPEYGKFEGYANRDSLKYQHLYGLEDVRTMFRGTLRRPGFCKAWNVFVQIGATDDSYKMENSKDMTYRTFMNSFLKYHPGDSVELKLMHYLQLSQDDIDVTEKLEWLDLFKDVKVGLDNASPAEVLQHILEQKWTLSNRDRDMIVIWHKFVFESEGKEGELQSSMVVTGEDQFRTAMAKTVGLPVAITAEQILLKKFVVKGVLRPLMKELYTVVLSELEKHSIRFEERRIK